MSRVRKINSTSPPITLYKINLFWIARRIMLDRTRLEADRLKSVSRTRARDRVMVSRSRARLERMSAPICSVSIAIRFDSRSRFVPRSTRSELCSKASFSKNKQLSNLPPGVRLLNTLQFLSVHLSDYIWHWVANFVRLLNLRSVENRSNLSFLNCS